MPDIFDLIVRWWKQILLITIIALVITATIIFLQPSQYLSVATAVPANSTLSDKSRVFNENIQVLYPGIGSADELDLVVGTGQLDTVYITVASAFRLWEHYKVKEQGDHVAANKAALILKHNTAISKSEFGELKVKVWDTDKNLAAQLANAIMEVLNSIHQGLQNATNLVTLQNLKSQQDSLLQEPDSLTRGPQFDMIRRQARLDQLTKYEKLINEYSTIINTNPRVLIVVDKAKPAERPDKPKRKLALVATGFLALLFGLFVALILERRKKTAS
jgi:uncharacterized protein involved in exopolysaccharide biosynthesis